MFLIKLTVFFAQVSPDGLSVSKINRANLFYLQVFSMIFIDLAGP